MGKPHFRVIGDVHGEFVVQTDHFLGDYGVHTVPGYGDIFFVRGGRSIDWQYRVEGRTWWRDEELSYAECLKAFELYKEVKPKAVFTHECPADIIELLAGFKTWDGKLILPSLTANMLNLMFDHHQPERWIFGHHHKNWSEVVKGTQFRCLGIMSYVDFEKV
jgi:hypothetical protein